MKRLKAAGIVLLSIVIVSAVVPLFIPKNHPFFAHFLNKNTISITVEEDLDIRLVEIRLNITISPIHDQLIFDGEDNYTIPKEYGENDWILIYNNEFETKFRHFKTNNWHDHHYAFHFYTDNDSIKCAVDIEGPNRRKLNRALYPK